MAHANEPLSVAVSADELQQFIDTFPLLLTVYQPDTRVLLLNREFQRLTGWSTAEAAGTSLLEKCYPDPRERERIRAFMEECGPGWIEVRMTTRDGREIDTSWANVRLPGDRRVGLGVDVTERRRGEEVLRASEQRFSRFMRHLPGLAWIKNLEGRYAYVNDEAARAFGRPKEDLYGRTDDEIFPPETAQQFQENDRLALAGETGRMTIESLEHEDGTVHYSMVTKFAIPGADGQPAMIAGMAFDITDWRRAEQALSESEARFRFLAEMIPSFVWTAAPDGSVTYANRRWLDYCGQTLAENAADWGRQIVHPDDYERCMSQWMEALREGLEFEIEVRNRRWDGAYRWFVTRAVPLRDADGRITSWFGVTTDIHDQKEMQERLREADRRKDEFLATLAHELRNPLAPIRNSLHLLRVGEPAANPSAVVDMMERQVDHMVRLVDDLLEVSRITLGKIELRRERVELADVLRNALETSMPSLSEAGHRLERRLPDEPVLLDADPVRLAQIIANLLNNAAKYTERPGVVELEARVEEADLVVSVRDDGRGIEPEFLPRVFEMFTQADHSTGRSRGGLGIGLTLAQSLARMHGGRIEARSDGAGKGSTFVVRLPVVIDGESGSREEPGTASSPAVERRRILVTDDVADSAESLAMLLRLWGHDARVAMSGQEALDAVERHPVDVVLLDIDLPDMQGYEVARRLRARPDGGGLRLVAMTGFGQAEDRRRSAAAGFDAHMVKPVDPAALKAFLSASPDGS